MGYEPKDGGDELLVNSRLVPIEMAGADATDGRFNEVFMNGVL